MAWPGVMTAYFVVSVCSACVRGGFCSACVGFIRWPTWIRPHQYISQVIILALICQNWCLYLFLSKLGFMFIFFNIEVWKALFYFLLAPVGIEPRAYTAYSWVISHGAIPMSYSLMSNHTLAFQNGKLERSLWSIHIKQEK